MPAFNTQTEAVQVLFKLNVEVNSQSAAGSTLLLVAVFRLGPYVLEGKVVDIVQRLLKHGARYTYT